jgi:hypothetical protein
MVKLDNDSAEASRFQRDYYYPPDDLLLGYQQQSTFLEFCKCLAVTSIAIGQLLGRPRFISLRTILSSSGFV